MKQRGKSSSANKVKEELETSTNSVIDGNDQNTRNLKKETFMNATGPDALMKAFIRIAGRAAISMIILSLVYWVFKITNVAFPELHGKTAPTVSFNTLSITGKYLV